MIGAVIGAVAAVAATAVSTGMSVKASREAEAQRKKQERGMSGQRLASSISAMKTADIAGQGGLSAGQYNRGLQQNDVYAQQVEGLVNKMESDTVFGNAYKNQAMAKLALNDISRYTRKTAQGLQDLDINMTVQNAQLAIEGASKTARIEADITRQENALAEQELARKQAIMQNVSKGIASTAQLVGASVKYYNAQQNLNTLKTGGTGIQTGIESGNQSVFKEINGVKYNPYDYGERSTPSVDGGFEKYSANRPQPVGKSLYGTLMNTNNVDAWMEENFGSPLEL